MPIMTPVNQLEPGMILASNVVHRFNVLLPYGRTISEDDIKSLQKHIPSEQVQISEPLLDDIVEFQDTSNDCNVSVEVRRETSNQFAKIGKLIRNGRDLRTDNISEIKQTISDMLEYVKNNPVKFAFIPHAGGGEDYLQEHSASVLYLSIIIGNAGRAFIKAGREQQSSVQSVANAMDLRPLATAALFHDIGMFSLERLYQKNGPLTKEELDMVKKHPATGAEMLSPEFDSMTRAIIRSHHENQNGSGYPNKLKGNKIPILARILRVADAFCAATSNKIYQKAKSQISVLYEMLYGQYSRFYDSSVMEVFTSLCQPFPIGSKIKIACGFTGVVVSYAQRDPFKPETIIAYDKNGNPLTTEQIKGPYRLGESKLIQAAWFNDEDVSYINNRPGQTPIAESEDIDKAIQEYSEIFDLAFP